MTNIRILILFGYSLCENDLHLDSAKKAVSVNHSCDVNLFCLSRDRFDILAILSVVTATDCGQEELLQCQNSLLELNEFSDLSFLSRKSNLQKQCPDLLNGLECIQSYTRRCMNTDQRAHFNKLYAGTSEMIHQLCQDNAYQEGKYVIY